MAKRKIRRNTNTLEAYSELMGLQKGLCESLRVPYLNLEKIHKENVKAKRTLCEKIMQGRDRITLCKSEVTPENAELFFSNTLHRIKRYSETLEIPVTTENIINNQMDDGSKFSRILLRKFRQRFSDYKLYFEAGDRAELPKLPEGGEGIGMDIFIQNFYSELKSSSATVILSARAADILQASENTPWSSCIRWRGEYASSTAVYLHDPCSLIMFFCRNGKRAGRAMVYFDEKTYKKFTIQRIYGFAPEHLITEARRSIQESISKSQKIRNRWKFQSTGLTGLSIEREAEVPYVDGIVTQSRHCTVGDYFFEVYFPAPLCLLCGGEHEYDHLICDCKHELFPRCSNCGELITEPIHSIVHTTGHSYHYHPHSGWCQDRAIRDACVVVRIEYDRILEYEEDQEIIAEPETAINETTLETSENPTWATFDARMLITPEQFDARTLTTPEQEQELVAAILRPAEV